MGESSTSCCFDSVCGVSLTKSVIIIGILELCLTLVATVLNIVKYAGAMDTYGEECEGKDVCIGPLIKYAVLDALFGVACSLMLIFGAKRRSFCLLILWMIITLLISIKYIWVVVTHDWTKLEDWISIVYLLFYISVFLIIINFMKEVKTVPSLGYVHANPPNTNTVVINQSLPPQPYQTQPQIYASPPPYSAQPPPQGYPPSYVKQQPSNPGY